MDEELKHLKESMDRTVLRDGAFREDEKQKILHTIGQRSQRSRKKERRQLRLGAVLSVAVCFCLLIGLSWFVYSQLNKEPQQTASESVKMDMAKSKENRVLSDKRDGDVTDEAAKNRAFHKDKVMPFKSMPKRDNGPDQSSSYIVLNNIHYKQTGKMVSQDQLGQEIGTTQRKGDRPTDSGAVQPGPIYAIHGKDPADYIAVKGSMVRDGKIKVGYLEFKKFQQR